MGQGDPEEGAERLAVLMKDDQEWERVVAASWKRAGDLLSFGAIAKTLISAIRESVL